MRFYLENFERHKRKGLEAYDRGDGLEAKYHLLKAAEYLFRLAGESEGQLKYKRVENAKKLVELARMAEDARAQSLRREKKVAEGTPEDKPGSEWIVSEKPKVRFDDIAGLDDVKEEIRIRMIYPFTHPEKATKFGIRKGGGLLLYGPPGTGKTMMAKAIAAELDATFFTVKPSEIMSKWVGEAEQNIDKLFDAARDCERAVIFVDEVEALIPKRRDSGSTVMQRVVPQILAELEGFDSDTRPPLLFVGATNEPWALDPAVLRPGRFDEKIYVPLPDKPARKKILEMNLIGKPIEDDVDLDYLAETLDGYSGADIRNICDKAAAAVFLEAIKQDRDRKITMADLTAVIAKVKPSVSPKQLERFEKFRDEHMGGG